MIDKLILARIAVFYHFVLEGFLVGIWSDFNPSFEESLNVSDSRYGAALLLFYAGTVIATSGASFLIRNIGSRKSTLIGALVFGSSMSLVALSNKNIVTFSLALFLFGYSEGIMDVSMNSCGVLTELVALKPLLGAYHGSYSIGAALGNLVGNSLIAKTNLTALTIFLIFGGISLILSVGAYKAMYSSSEEKELTNIDRSGATITSPLDNHNKEYESISSVDDSTFLDNTENNDSSSINNDTRQAFCDYLNNLLAIPHGTEALSIIGFIASFGESSITSWANTYYNRSLDSSSFTQGFGFIAFMICMATGRFLCDRLRLRFGRKRIFFVAGFLAAGGLLVAISSPSISSMIDQKSNSFEIAIATIGFSMTGLGLSTLIPTCFSSAGNLPNVHAGTAIGTVAFFTYSGSIVAPYILGLISDGFNSDLRIAFLADAILLILITPLSYYVPPETFSNQSNNPAIKTQLLSMDDQE